MNVTEMEKQRKIIDGHLAVVKRMKDRYPSFEFSIEDEGDGHWLLVGRSLQVCIAVKAERARTGAKIEYQRGPVRVNGKEISTEQKFVDGRNVNGPSALLHEALGLSRRDNSDGNYDPETWFDHGVWAAAGFLERQLDALKSMRPDRLGGTAS